MDCLGVIGTGNMGAAIIRGVCEHRPETRIFAFDKDAGKLESLPVTACADARDVVEKAGMSFCR